MDEFWIRSCPATTSRKNSNRFWVGDSLACQHFIDNDELQLKHIFSAISDSYHFT